LQRGEAGGSTEYTRDLEFSEIRMVQPAGKKIPLILGKRRRPLQIQNFFLFYCIIFNFSEKKM